MSTGTLRRGNGATGSFLSLLFLTWVILTSTAIADPTDFSFHDETLETIFSKVAQAGNFRASIDPTVAKLRMTVTLRQVEPLDALFLLARIQELQVKRKPAPPAGPLNYHVWRSDRIVRTYCCANSRTIQLRHADCKAVADSVRKGLHKKEDLGIEIDARTNRILIKGTDAAMEQAAKEILLLDKCASAGDQPVPNVRSLATEAKSDLDLDGI